MLVPIALAYPRPLSMAGVGYVDASVYLFNCDEFASADLLYSGTTLSVEFDGDCSSRSDAYSDSECSWNAVVFTCSSWHYPSWGGGCQTGASHLTWSESGYVLYRLHPHGSYPGCGDGIDWAVYEGSVVTTAVYPPGPQQ